MIRLYAEICSGCNSATVRRVCSQLFTDMISYIERIGSGEDLREEIEVLKKEDAMEEFMFLGLRKMQGISRFDPFYIRSHVSAEMVSGIRNKRRCSKTNP